MQDIYFILSKLPVVIEILFMLSRFVYPRNGKQLLDIERDIYRLTAKIGDQFVLRMLEKVHQDPEFVAKAVQRARLIKVFFGAAEYDQPKVNEAGLTPISLLRNKYELYRFDTPQLAAGSFINEKRSL